MLRLVLTQFGLCYIGDVAMPLSSPPVKETYWLRPPDFEPTSPAESLADTEIESRSPSPAPDQPPSIADTSVFELLG